MRPMPRTVTIGFQGLLVAKQQPPLVHLRCKLAVDGQFLAGTYEITMRLAIADDYQATNLELVSVAPPVAGVRPNWLAFADAASVYCQKSIGADAKNWVLHGTWTGGPHVTSIHVDAFDE